MFFPGFLHLNNFEVGIFFLQIKDKLTPTTFVSPNYKIRGLWWQYLQWSLKTQFSERDKRYFCDQKTINDSGYLQQLLRKRNLKSHVGTIWLRSELLCVVCNNLSLAEADSSLRCWRPLNEHGWHRVQPAQPSASPHVTGFWAKRGSQKQQDTLSFLPPSGQQQELAWEAQSPAHSQWVSAWLSESLWIKKRSTQPEVLSAVVPLQYNENKGLYKLFWCC